MERTLGMLARYRQNNDLARQMLVEMIQQLEAEPKYAYWRQRKAEAERECAEAEKLIKADVLAYLKLAGEKPDLAGVGTRGKTTLVYNDQQALAWCAEHLPQALVLDRGLFEKHARAVLETSPAPCVTVVRETIATIGQDLSGYLSGDISEIETAEGGFPF